MTMWSIFKMSALSKIVSAGFSVFLKGENFGIAPSENLTETQREFLKSHKVEIIEELKKQDEQVIISEPLIVICWTPAGKALEIQAIDEENAKYLQQVNPKPKLLINYDI